MTTFWKCVWRLVWWRGDQSRGVIHQENHYTVELLGVIYSGCACHKLESVILLCDISYSDCKMHKKIHHVQINLILFSSETALSISVTKTPTNSFISCCTHIKVLQRSETREKNNESKNEKHNRNKDQIKEHLAHISFHLKSIIETIWSWIWYMHAGLTPCRSQRIHSRMTVFGIRG